MSDWFDTYIDWFLTFLVIAISVCIVLLTRPTSR